ncbi:MAG: hypothetical protein A2270_09105 [Elusimicrobia bacterium RIFOXYA12_FULL_51_18]|nr:MAG: hypothetical protein A2270_09105 [Elusimicrobia bacterium RIFOXYA12_FULL_51_18]OGS32242.1 MAG: hypothetical protein A2218_03990 [Elusimicrobia bacterium RIFOXYA2_FULL_53_38]
MKASIFIVSLLTALNGYADIITLKDGTRLEGSVEGEMDGVKLIKTKYGSLNINKNDIQNIEAPVIAAAEPFKSSTAAVSISSPAVTPPIETISLSTPSGSAATAPAELPAGPGPDPKCTFKTVTLSTISLSFEKIYFENDIAIATETFDAKGELLGLQGFIKDGSYKEYYNDGNLKTEKTIINTKTSGPLKAYYPNGVLQSEAYYQAGRLNGAVRFFNKNAKLMFEQTFKDGIQDGFSREFDETGDLRSELFYIAGRTAEKPKTAETPAPETESDQTSPESMVTAKIQSLARGERFTFYLNDKYVAKLTLDNDLNITSKTGKVPDGMVKVYNKDGKLEKAFVFVKNEIGSLKVYNKSGMPAEEYTFNKNGEAVKK